MTHTVQATKRIDGTGSKKNASLRKEGRIPAVCYGKKDEAVAIALDRKDFTKIYNQVGESTVITVAIEGDTTIDTLIHDIQYHPVSGDIIHADLYIFDKDAKQEVDVTLVFTGSSPAEKDGLIVNRTMYELTIEALPMNLPHDLSVPLDGMINIDSVLLAKDIKLPPGVELVTNPEDVVMSVSEEREDEPEEVEEVDMDSIEVDGKDKTAAGEDDDDESDNKDDDKK